MVQFTFSWSATTKSFFPSCILLYLTMIVIVHNVFVSGVLRAQVIQRLIVLAALMMKVLFLLVRPIIQLRPERNQIRALVCVFLLFLQVMSSIIFSWYSVPALNACETAGFQMNFVEIFVSGTAGFNSVLFFVLQMHVENSLPISLLKKLWWNNSKGMTSPRQLRPARHMKKVNCLPRTTHI
jgi:hypothetical protein